MVFNIVCRTRGRKNTCGKESAIIPSYHSKDGEINDLSVELKV
jgi:hypothetical protein